MLQFIVSIVILAIVIIVNTMSITDSLNGTSSSVALGLPLLVIIIALMAFGALSTVYFAVKKKDDYKLIIITGIRNIGFFIVAMGFTSVYFSTKSYIEYYGWRNIIFQLRAFGAIQYLSVPIMVLTVSIGGYVVFKKYWVKK
jgi:hypothetical protein